MDVPTNNCAVIPISGWYMELRTGERLPIIAATIDGSRLVPWVSSNGGDPEPWTIDVEGWVHESALSAPG